MLQRGLLTLIILPLAACTSLSTVSDRRTTQASEAVTGIPYSLPMLQYEVKVTRTLTQCFEPDAAGQPTTTPHVIITAKVEATPKYVPGETYLVDYRALAGFTKISSMSIANYESSGTLHTFNASAEDRSAQIIQSGVRSIANIAALAAGIPPPTLPAAGGPAPIPQMLVCTPAAQAQLAKIAARTADLKTATDNLEKLTQRITLLTEQARLNSISDAGRQELTGPGGLIEQQRAATQAVASNQSRLDREQIKVSSVVQLRWPRSFPTSHDSGTRDPQLEDTVPLDELGLGRLASMLSRTAVTLSQNGEENLCGTSAQSNSEAIRECLQKKLTVGLALDRLGPVPANNVVTTAEDGMVSAATPANGIFIRPPARGRLMACQLAREERCTETSGHVLLRTDDAVVPQLGQLRFLPFQNEMFQNNALSLTLRVDGSVERFEYKETSARGEAVATTVEGAVGQMQALAQALRAGETAEAAAAAAQLTADRSAALATIQFEIDRLTRESQLNALQNPPAVTALAAVQAETAQVNARVALLQALLAERNATAALTNGQ